MARRHVTVGVSLAISVAVLASLAAAAGSAATRPHGVVEDCSRVSGFGASPRDFERRANLVIGPLAILRAGATLPYAEQVGGNKLFVVVKGGHRVTLELTHATRLHAGFVFGRFRLPDVDLADSRRVVTFVACGRGEAGNGLSGWPVSGWVGGLLAVSPRCVPIRVWVDDEPRARRAVIRFGVARCG